MLSLGRMMGSFKELGDNLENVREEDLDLAHEE
jgi:hypothetical protein